MRLKWGPHASETPEQVVLRDPQYVATVLAEQPDGALAAIFRDLITRFDSRTLIGKCTRCGRGADGVCAYPGSVVLIGFCERCVLVSPATPPRSAVRVTTYEDALRHVATSFRRSHRDHSRRLVIALTLAKGGPARATQAAAEAFLSASPACLPPPQGARPLRQQVS